MTLKKENYINIQPCEKIDYTKKKMSNIKSTYEFVNVDDLCLVKLSSIVSNLEGDGKTNSALCQRIKKRQYEIARGLSKKGILIYSQSVDGKVQYLLDQNDFITAIDILAETKSKYGKRYDGFKDEKDYQSIVRELSVVKNKLDHPKYIRIENIQMDYPRAKKKENWQQQYPLKDPVKRVE